MSRFYKSVAVTTISTAALFASLLGSALASTEGGTTVVAGKPKFSCEEAIRFRENVPEYKKLQPHDQFGVDMQFHLCQNPDTVAVVQTDPQNPSKVAGFGVLNKDDVANIKNTCKNVGLATAGVLGSGTAAANTNPACEGLAYEISRGNSLVVLAPVTVAGMYVAAGFAASVLSKKDAENVINVTTVLVGLAPRINFGKDGAVFDLPDTTVDFEKGELEIGGIKTDIPKPPEVPPLNKLHTLFK